MLEIGTGISGNVDWSRWFKMMTLSVRLAFSIVPLVFGTSLPLFSIGSLREPINLPWGFVFGFGWYLAGFVANFRSPLVVLWGALIWPIIVCTVLFILSGRINYSEWSYGKIIALSLFVASLIVLVPQSLTSVPPLRNIPFYPNILAAWY